MGVAEEGSGLDSAHRAFERGDFAEARKLARQMKSSSDETARAAADTLLARMSLDPLIVGVSTACLVGYVLIAVLAR